MQPSILEIYDCVNWKESRLEYLKRLIAIDPPLSLETMGHLLGISKQRVHQLVHKNGLTRQPVPKSRPRTASGVTKRTCPKCGGLKAKSSRQCLKCRSLAQRKGPTIDSMGYVRMPRYIARDGPIKEHQIVAEEVLGRGLQEGEVVHHLNGNKCDNRPENLAVMSAAEHNRVHAPERKREADGD